MTRQEQKLWAQFYASAIRGAVCDLGGRSSQHSIVAERAVYAAKMATIGVETLRTEIRAAELASEVVS